MGNYSGLSMADHKGEVNVLVRYCNCKTRWEVSQFLNNMRND